MKIELLAFLLGEYSNLDVAVVTFVEVGVFHLEQALVEGTSLQNRQAGLLLDELLLVSEIERAVMVHLNEVLAAVYDNRDRDLLVQ